MKPYTDEALKIAHSLFYKRNQRLYENFETFCEDWEDRSYNRVVSVEIDAVRAILEAMGYDQFMKAKREIYIAYDDYGREMIVGKNYPLAKCFVEK